MSTPDPEFGRSIEAAGIKTNYHDQGEGPPVVLIHGSGPGSPRMRTGDSRSPSWRSAFA